MTILSAIGVTEIITDTTEKISLNFGKTLESYDKTQENFFGVVDNGVVGVYNVADDVVDKGAQIIYDTEIRAISSFDNIIEKVAMILYDTLEVFSYLFMFMIIVVIIILLLFHAELLEFSKSLSETLLRVLGGLVPKIPVASL